MSEPKVRELFEKEKITLDFIEAKFDGDYWRKSHRFVKQYWHTSVDFLSEKQLKWLHRIVADCTEKRIESGWTGL